MEGAGAFNQLLCEVEANSKQLRSCVETLIIIFRNIFHYPTEGKYRSIKLRNKKFNENVWQFQSAQKYMKDCGWQFKVGEGGIETLVYPDDKDIKSDLTFLIDNRDVKPLEEEWVDETKIIIPNAEKEQERQLRFKANVKKQKEIIELKKDMAERKAIAETIIAEHRNDRNKRIYHKAARATDLKPSIDKYSQKMSHDNGFPQDSQNVLGAAPSTRYGTPSRPESPSDE